MYKPFQLPFTPNDQFWENFSHGGCLYLTTEERSQFLEAVLTEPVEAGKSPFDTSSEPVLSRSPIKSGKE
jgi:hypothetical protein